jgi:hypothetical protein
VTVAVLRCFILFAAGALLAPAHDVITTKLTWSAEISRIVYRRCVSCHQDGGAAPMSLVNYEDARPWAKAIRDEVLKRTMPPWGAVKGYRDLNGDMGLTQDEITRIAEWVEGGAPEGDPKYLPSSLPKPIPAEKPPQGRRNRAATLAADSTVLGVKPLISSENSKIYALRPDGSTEPLLWLHGYKAEWSRTFTFAEPLRLPAGTKVISNPSTPVELLLKPAPLAR